MLIISIIKKECAYSVLILRNNQNYQKIVIYPIKPIIHIANYIYISSVLREKQITATHQESKHV